jgi:hypothetical protein
MYNYNPLQDMITGAEQATTKEVARYGVKVFVDTDPDLIAADFVIDPADETGLVIFREFAQQMVEHYKSLQDGHRTEA